MIQFTTGQGGMMDAFRDPDKVRRPVPRRVKMAHTVTVIVAVVALAVFAGLIGLTVRTGNAIRPPAQVVATQATGAGQHGARNIGGDISSGVFARRHVA